MLRRMLVILVATILAMAGIGATSAQATGQVTDCEELLGICLYDGSRYSGDWYYISVPTRTTSYCVTLPNPQPGTGLGWSNRANSATNSGRGSHVYFYDSSNCTGTPLGAGSMEYGETWDSLLPDNRASSLILDVWLG